MILHQPDIFVKLILNLNVDKLEQAICQKSRKHTCMHLHVCMYKGIFETLEYENLINLSTPFLINILTNVRYLSYVGSVF